MYSFIPAGSETLPFNEKTYINYLSDIETTEWQGFSIQQRKPVSKEGNLIEEIQPLLKVFKGIFSSWNGVEEWIIKHDDKFLPWFNQQDSVSNELPKLKKVFTENNHLLSFKGSIKCTTEGLFQIAEEILLYPYILSYKNIDIINTEIPFIVKTTSHLTIDILYQKHSFVDNLANSINKDTFNILPYR